MLVTVQLDDESLKKKAAKVGKCKLPLVLEKKLIINEGTHNGVYYPADELHKSLSAFDNISVFLDHMDKTQNWVGELHNVSWDSTQNGIVGDLFIVDLPVAQKLDFGAKWGVSATMSVDSVRGPSGLVARDILPKSVSLVVDPSVKETMLNEKQEEEDIMPEENEASEENAFGKPPFPFQPKKKYPYPMPPAGKLEDQPESAVKAELESRIKALEAERLSGKARALADREVKMGMLKPEELEARVTALSKRSSETLEELASVYGKIETELSKEPAKPTAAPTTLGNRQVEKLSAQATSADEEMLGFLRNNQRRN